ncbi:MAG: 4'-phosphopantetheinyl transferase family protein [Dissulfurispiraceae bacterium]
MAKDHEGITVHTMNYVHQMGPVFYASLPFGACDTEPISGHQTNGDEARHRLVSTLWDYLAVVESPLWQRSQYFNRGAFPIQVLRGPLGRPQLMLGEHQGPAISFSESGGKVWAALCGDGSDIGIDVAGTNEFQREYPLHRVFHPQELQHALKLAAENLEMASALLWSIKEAVVKALGCAFHLVDPRQITVYPTAGGWIGWNVGYIFQVGLSGKALMRFPLAAGQSLLVHSIPQRKMWLSIALLNRRAIVHE